MGNKVTFDPTTKIIQVNEAPTGGVVELDVKVDLYSDGKEDWRDSADLFKYRFPIRAVGGDPLPGSKSLGSTFFLANGWTIRPYEADHRLIVNGNLYVEDGSSPYTTTVGTYNVLIEAAVSSLVDSTVQQLPEIEFASYQGGVTYDEVNGVAGTDYPVGTVRSPVNNAYDAATIAQDVGLRVGYIIGDMTLPTDLPLTGFRFIGSGIAESTITIPDAATVEECTYLDATVTGYLDGSNVLKDCQIENLNYVKGFITQCILAPGTITLAGSEVAHFLDCWSGQPGTGTPTIDMGGSGQALALRNYNGGIKIQNKTGPESVSIDLNSGQVIIDDTVTNGDIVLRGVGKWTNKETYTGGANVINELVEGHELQDVYAATFHRRTRNPITGREVIYETDGITERHAFTTTDDGTQITEIAPE